MTTVRVVGVEDLEQLQRAAPRPRPAPSSRAAARGRDRACRWCRSGSGPRPAGSVRLVPSSKPSRARRCGRSGRARGRARPRRRHRRRRAPHRCRESRARNRVSVSRPAAAMASPSSASCCRSGVHGRQPGRHEGVTAGGQLRAALLRGRMVDRQESPAPAMAMMSSTREPHHDRHPHAVWPRRAAAGPGSGAAGRRTWRRRPSARAWSSRVSMRAPRARLPSRVSCRSIRRPGSSWRGCQRRSSTCISTAACGRRPRSSWPGNAACSGRGHGPGGDARPAHGADALPRPAGPAAGVRPAHPR